MKVLLVNGSPHPHGCTHTALEEMTGIFRKENIEAEIFQVGTKPLSGCLGCQKCAQLGQCFLDDRVNEFNAAAQKADGFIFGSPVHYAAADGAITSLLDRAFYSAARAGKNIFRLKPAAAVVSARRGGTTAALDQLNKYFAISEMPIISSQYWNMVHGNSPEEVRQDLEGLQIMRVLARNMAWFLKCKEAGSAAGAPQPEREERLITNFIR